MSLRGTVFVPKQSPTWQEIALYLVSTGLSTGQKALLRNKSRLCHCEALFAEAISTSQIGDRFGGKAPPRDDTWSFFPYE